MVFHHPVYASTCRQPLRSTVAVAPWLPSVGPCRAPWRSSHLHLHRVSTTPAPHSSAAGVRRATHRTDPMQHRTHGSPPFPSAPPLRPPVADAWPIVDVFRRATGTGNHGAIKPFSFQQVLLPQTFQDLTGTDFQQHLQLHSRHSRLRLFHQVLAGGGQRAEA